MARIYTRTGDSGETSLRAGRRVRKDDPRVEAIGAVDEANAALGVVRMELGRSGAAPAGLDNLLARVQHRLFDLGAELAIPPAAEPIDGTVGADHVAAMEAAIDHWDAQLPPLQNFVLPGGVPAAAQLHLARCVCRRAERRLVELAAAQPVPGELIGYFNRLGDLLFVLARLVNQANGVSDVIWEPGP